MQWSDNRLPRRVLATRPNGKLVASREETARDLQCATGAFGVGASGTDLVSALPAAQSRAGAAESEVPVRTLEQVDRVPLNGGDRHRREARSPRADARDLEPLRAVRDHLSETVHRVERQRDRVVITRNDRQAAVLPSGADLAELPCRSSPFRRRSPTS